MGIGVGAIELKRRESGHFPSSAGQRSHVHGIDKIALQRQFFFLSRFSDDYRFPASVELTNYSCCFFLLGFDESACGPNEAHTYRECQEECHRRHGNKSQVGEKARVRVKFWVTCTGSGGGGDGREDEAAESEWWKMRRRAGMINDY